MSDITYKILEDGRILLAIPPDRKSELVNLLNRALNCFPEAAPDFKHLSDILQHGAPLVDYYAQEASTRMRHTEP